MNDPRGSIWRKWDLHVHTPASFHWNDGIRYREMPPKQKGESLLKLAATMQDSDIGAFGIMDYWTFDGYTTLVQWLKDNPQIKFEKAIFPGMELRIESPTDFRLNIHVLLSNSLTVQNLTDFKSELKLRIGGKLRGLSDESLIDLARHLDPSKAEIHGFTGDALKEDSNLILLGSKTAEVTRDSFLDACKSLPSASVIIILPYDTSDGFSKLDWKTHGHSANEMLQMAHMFETRSPDNVDLFLGRVTEKNQHFIEIFQKAMGGSAKPAISGSDAHQYSEYGRFPGDRATWLKADPTWEGLASVMYEPLERSFIGISPPQLEKVNNNRTLYIKSLEINKIKDSELNEAWFDETKLPLNHGLVAIIGNKGSGKSALTDIVGLLGNSKRQKWFPFLSSKQFRKPSNNKARHFEAMLTWESDAIETCTLNDDCNEKKLESLNYVPQDCFEDICNELASAEESNFDKELKEVIFSHVAISERLGKATLDELVEFKTNEIERGIEILRRNVEKLNSELIDLEEQSSSENRDVLEEQRQKKQAELGALEKAKPPVVQKPKTKTKEAQQLQKQLTKLGKDRNRADKDVKHAEENQGKTAILISNLDKILERISLFEKQYQEILLESKKDLQNVEIDVTSIVRLAVDRQPILQKQSELKAFKAQLDDMLNPTNKKGSLARKQDLEERISKLRGKLDEPNQKYQRYDERLREWKRNCRAISGSRTTVDTLKYYEAKLRELDALPDLIVKKKDQRMEKVSAIYDEITRLTMIYGDLYAGVQNFINSHPLAKHKFNLLFDVSVINIAFEERFFELVSQGVTGSFYGVDEGHNLLHDLIGKYDFSSKQETFGFLEKLMEYLHKDIRTGQAVTIDDQLRKGRTRKLLYDLIYSFGYLAPRYVLKMGDKQLSELSPGEKGTLLLIFYLLVDKSETPLIIDQPEHNLDNETIYDLLVPAIKEAKRRRQIVVVTHNPNIAIVSDADQIICAHLEKKNNSKIIYTSGAIENPRINRRIVDVLEGTMPAFDNRGMKYTAARLRLK
jgi:ABC-type lipoprotein export system ATPase subunit